MNTELTQLQKRINNLKVLVMGDLILDEYLETDVERISPEAPVPVAIVKDSINKLGGAANVAWNVSMLGAKTTLFGISGKDLGERKIKQLCKKNKINFVSYNPKYFFTTIKTRVVSKGAQIVRIDKEKKDFQIDKIDKRKLKNKLSGLIEKTDLIILSDYEKGLFDNEILDFIKSKGKFVSIDTKSKKIDLSGFSLIKKNLKETLDSLKYFKNFEEYENRNKDIENLGKFLIEKTKSPLLITRDEKGASFIGKKIVHAKTKVSTVYDVTGAGDTCNAAFSLFMYLNLPVEKSLSLMNHLAKITISHMGTYAPRLNEIEWK